MFSGFETFWNTGASDLENFKYGGTGQQEIETVGILIYYMIDYVSENVCLKRNLKYIANCTFFTDF